MDETPLDDAAMHDNEEITRRMAGQGIIEGRRDTCREATEGLSAGIAIGESGLPLPMPVGPALDDLVIGHPLDPAEVDLGEGIVRFDRRGRSGQTLHEDAR